MFIKKKNASNVHWNRWQDGGHTDVSWLLIKKDLPRQNRLLRQDYSKEVPDTISHTPTKQNWARVVSSSDHYNPLLDIGLSNFSPSRSIFGYSNPALNSVLRKSSLHLACPTLRLPRRGLHSRTRLPQRLSVLQFIWSVHRHFSMLIRCAMSVTLVLYRITWLRIRSRP
jgi:hypothetical protein